LTDPPQVCQVISAHCGLRQIAGYELLTAAHSLSVAWCRITVLFIGCPGRLAAPCQCAGNRWLPRIELAADLEGGGSVVFLEFVAPVGHPVAGQFAGQWRARASDPEFQEMRRAAQRIDAEYRTSTPWWGRCDLDDAPAGDNRQCAAAGHLTAVISAGYSCRGS
jgi:hypothetical protein